MSEKNFPFKFTFIENVKENSVRFSLSYSYDDKNESLSISHNSEFPIPIARLRFTIHWLSKQTLSSALVRKRISEIHEALNFIKNKEELLKKSHLKKKKRDLIFLESQRKKEERHIEKVKPLYEDTPPQELVDKINKIMGLNYVSYLVESKCIIFLEFPSVHISHQGAMFLNRYSETTETITAFRNFVFEVFNSPSPVVVANIFDYFADTNLQLTPEGYIVAYRKVWTTNKIDNVETTEVVEAPEIDPALNVELEAYVRFNWIRIKSQKRTARNFDIYLNPESNEFFLNDKSRTAKPDSSNVFIANLQTKYEEFDQSSSKISKDIETRTNIDSSYQLVGKYVDKERFTDGHTGECCYYLGGIHRMDWRDADLSSKTCSRGYHFSTFEWVRDNTFNGNRMIVGIIRPSKLCSIPGDNYPKFRCVEWYFAAIMDPKDESVYKNLLICDFGSYYQKIIYDSLKQKKAALLGKMTEWSTVNKKELTVALTKLEKLSDKIDREKLYLLENAVSKIERAESEDSIKSTINQLIELS